MKKNLDYQSVLFRKNVLKEMVLNFFFSISSGPRLLLEVFIRKNFGERYFYMASAYTVAILLSIIPLLSHGLLFIFSRYGGYRLPNSFLWDNKLWYGFIVAFLIMSVKRNREIKRSPSVFDFAKHTRYPGIIDKRFYTLFGKNWTIREVETFVEPVFFFVIGLGILIIDRSLGWLLIVSSICYSISYRGAYYNGDNFVMDIIDKQILNEELVNAVVDGKQGEDTRGVRIYGRIPITPEARRKLLPHLFDEEKISSAEVI